MYLQFKFCMIAALILIMAGTRKSQLMDDPVSDIIADILSILTTGIVTLTGNCTGFENNAPETNYWIYINSDPTNYTLVTEPTPTMCGGRSKIIFITHGWSWDANAPYVIGIKDAYFTKYDDPCIISVNWGAYAIQSYQSAYCAAPSVASNIANFICKMKTDLNINTETLHLVGHSIGAHVFGIAGSMVQYTCDTKVARITGLDPAGPLYQEIAIEDRLDPSDATFVDAIHTNQGQFGYVGSCGHLDSFPNCGYYQPGCLTNVLGLLSENITEIANLPLDLISCSHRRSCDYFEESINSDRFLGQRCLSCDLPLCVRMPSEKKVIGEGSTATTIRRNYVLNTRSSPPYAKG